MIKTENDGIFSCDITNGKVKTIKNSQGYRILKSDKTPVKLEKIWITKTFTDIYACSGGGGGGVALQPDSRIIPESNSPNLDFEKVIFYSLVTTQKSIIIIRRQRYDILRIQCRVSGCRDHICYKYIPEVLRCVQKESGETYICSV